MFSRPTCLSTSDRLGVTHLLSWVPVVGDALVAFTGAIKMPFAAFSALTTLGKLLRYVAAAWAVAAAT